MSKASDFMEWYGANFERLKTALVYKGQPFDDEVATDTALRIYKIIDEKGAEIRDYAKYYFRAYRMAYIQKARAEIKRQARHKGLEGKTEPEAPDFSEFEQTADQIRREVLGYVRENYTPFECALFEMYLGLYPNTSYNRLAKMLGVSRFTVYTTIGKMRKDVKEKYKRQVNFLRTLI